MEKVVYLSRRDETPNVSTITFESNKLEWTAGQYLALVIPEVSSILEKYEHWFTISSPPFQRQIEITFRHSHSPFKQALLSLKKGDSIFAHTVDGDFFWPIKQAPVFVAGGIGITPFISMLRQRKHETNFILSDLYYFNRSDQIVFKQELDDLTKINPEFSTHYINMPPLSLDVIENWQEKFNNKIVHLAGPVPMVDRMGQELLRANIEYKQDFYFGYDISNY